VEGMDVKFFEVRDRGTHMFCMGTLIGISPEQFEKDSTAAKRVTRMLVRGGYAPGPGHMIMFGSMSEPCRFSCDPYEHGKTRTLGAAHDFVAEHWDLLKTGDVIDVEYILGETCEIKESEFVGDPMHEEMLVAMNAIF